MSNISSRVGFFCLVWTVMVAGGASARAQSPAAPDAGASAEIARLTQSREAVRYSLTVPGVSIKAGAAMLAIDAPVATVKQIITDYAHYQDVLPGFQRSRILGKTPVGTDVYLQAPILHGAATLWAVVKFAPAVREGVGERIEGKKTGQANLDDLRATWHFYPIDADHTVLKLEFLMVPSLPLPGAMVTPQLEESSEDAVRAVRDRAETLMRRRSESQAGSDGSADPPGKPN
jgi:ribosome-associated toxin RatA of RatAB toxin-antitoxin module